MYSLFSLFAITLPPLLNYPTPSLVLPYPFSSVTLCSSGVTRPNLEHSFSKFVLPSPLHLVHPPYLSSLPSLFCLLPAIYYTSLFPLFPISETSFFMFISFCSCNITFFLHSPAFSFVFFHLLFQLPVFLYPISYYGKYV